MNNIIPDNLYQYFGSNALNALKFIRNLSKNMNNSRILSNSPNNKDKIEGYVIGIYSLIGLSNNPKELIINNSKNYYIRFFISIYNKSTRQLYGNTYRSPLFPVEIKPNYRIEFDIKNPFCFYVLSQEPKHEFILVQIILVETNQDNVILQEKCQGWTLLKLVKNRDNNNNQEEKTVADINRGTPRDLIYTNNFIEYHGAKMSYIATKYPQLELINFLLPTNIVVAYNEQLPGLRLRALPQYPTNDALKTVEFISAYVKNIIIEINPDLEQHILDFGKEYRLNKYKVEENEFNKVYIKERRIKCGMHNTWKFINSNGIQNSITLTKISKNKLQSNGVLMIDRFFSDHLSCSAVVMELEYVLTIPIKEQQNEENLNLILGYHLYVPEKINEGNYSKEKLLMFTGPGNTINGEKMFNLGNSQFRNIRISYILSQNVTLNYVNQVEMDEFTKQKMIATQNALIDQNNQMILQKVQPNNDISEKIDENKNKNINDLLPAKGETEALRKKIADLEEETINLQLKLKKKELIENNIQKAVGKNVNGMNEISFKKAPEKKFDETVQEKPKEMKMVSLKDNPEYQEFIHYMKELEEKIDNLKEMQKPKVKDYEMPIKNITSRDKSNLTKKGIKELVLNEQVNSYIDYSLDKELCERELATNFIFKFLSFKPSRLYYSDLRNVPEKIQFVFDFFYESKLYSSVCNVSRPEDAKSNNYYYFNNPLILKKENINTNSVFLNDTKSEVIIEVRYDPSIDTSIDFRDFIKYMLYKRLVVQIKDAQKCLNVGFIKIPLTDLLQGKDKIQITKEYEIFDDNFNLKGYIQLLITASKYKTLRPYSYDRNKFTNINSKEGYNTLSKKKKVKAEQMDMNKLMRQNKDFYNKVINSLKSQNNNNNIDETNTNLINEMSQSRLRKLRIEPEIEKQLRVMRYFNTKNDPNYNSNMSNTNYPLNSRIQQDEKRLNELKQKQVNDEQFMNTLTACEKFRDFNRDEVLSKVSQENHKNVYTISLIMGQPIYFNYSVFNDSSLELLCHITIDKINKNKDDNNSINSGNRQNKIVQILSTPIEWKRIVEKEKLKKPNNYEKISDNLDMILKPGETIPLVVKLLSFVENREEENYAITINKKNGQPLFFLLINIKKVFPIYDHIFHYNFPIKNQEQRIILVNPFSHKKTLEMLHNVIIQNNRILELDEDSHNFIFRIEPDNYNYQHYFVIFFYSDEERTNLYLTWKIEINWIANYIKINGIKGRKENHEIEIKNIPQSNEGASYSGNNLTLQLFSDYPDVIIFPPDSKKHFTLKPNSMALKNFILYPRKEGDTAIINCVNIHTREIYQSWMIKYSQNLPEIDDCEKIVAIIGGKNVVDYKYTNPSPSKISVLSFYSGNEDIMEVIDRIAVFNEDEEEKNIKLKFNDKGKVETEEVLLFISDDSNDFCRTIIFKINFTEN